MSATKKTGSRLLRVLLAALASFVLLAAGCAADEEAGNAASEKVKRAVAEAASSEEGVCPVAEVASRVEPSVVQVNVSSIQTTPFPSRARARACSSDSPSASARRREMSL